MPGKALQDIILDQHFCSQGRMIYRDTVFERFELPILRESANVVIQGDRFRERDPFVVEQKVSRDLHDVFADTAGVFLLEDDISLVFMVGGVK
jgi:hypothetical protein